MHDGGCGVGFFLCLCSLSFYIAVVGYLMGGL